MYAVVRAGGKQYRVAPGDVIKVEKFQAGDNGQIELEPLAVSTEEGKLAGPQAARVLGQVVEEGRADKILVFHYKKKKQYKKLNGHRQGFTAVRIAEISVDGQSFKAPEQAAKPEKKAKPAKAEAAAPEVAAGTKHKTAAKKSAAKKSTTKKK
jgi:large subunit ribosomal protein L21